MAFFPSKTGEAEAEEEDDDDDGDEQTLVSIPDDLSRPAG